MRLLLSVLRGTDLPQVCFKTTTARGSASHHPRITLMQRNLLPRSASMCVCMCVCVCVSVHTKRSPWTAPAPSTPTRQASTCLELGVDVLAFETIPDLEEGRAVATVLEELAAKGKGGAGEPRYIPALHTRGPFDLFSYSKTGRRFSPRPMGSGISGVTFLCFMICHLGVVRVIYGNFMR